MLTETMTGVAAVVLGIMQDAGLPHVGCRCPRCAAAYDNPARGGQTACLALVDARTRPAGVWLLDATPDIARQMNDLAPLLGPHPHRPARLRPPDALFLTHGHMGHVGGLPQCGPEGMAVEKLPVYASPALAAVIRKSAIWRPLMAHLAWRELTDGVSITLAPGLALTPLSVPHRDEWGAGTFAFRIDGPTRSLLYVPDIDSWAAWSVARQAVAAVDVALVDGTFFGAAELGGRPPVAHPLIPDTLAFFDLLVPKLMFTHLNHTNPALDEGSEERKSIDASGATIARQGQVISLSE